MKKKKANQVDTGQKVQDIDIADYLFYLQKDNRKLMQKAYSGVKFEDILLSTNDKTGGIN